MTGMFDLPSPPETGLPPPRDWPLLARFAVRAAIELVRARAVFRKITVPAIQARNAVNAPGVVPETADPLLGWIAYIMPRAARRMPFRSDCLVQALAAQSWLASHGISSAIMIGAERPADKPFAAHAWLTCGSRVITGGDVAHYTALI